MHSISRTESAEAGQFHVSYNSKFGMAYRQPMFCFSCKKIWILLTKAYTAEKNFCTNNKRDMEA